MKQQTPYLFLLLALTALLIGMFFGLIAALQYIFPDFLKEFLAFNKVRPLHVSSIVSWIILGSTGVVYWYLALLNKPAFAAPKIAVWHFVIFLITGVLVISFLLLGIFGGREYMAYSPILSVPIWIGWVLFAIGFFTTVRKKIKGWPVFLWMWATGIAFFIFTFTEAHLWLIPWFRGNFIRDLTVQWKSYGSLVGSWNMLIYGTAIYIMYSIHRDEKIIYGKLPFFLFFTGLVNLMFGWGHHTYILPAQPWIRHIAYFISMTELLILGKMLWDWRKSLTEAKKHLHIIPYRFLYSADYWIALNLILAILISIPYINFYTHGTHITVAHAMGATIGINTTILLSAIFYIAFRKQTKINPSYSAFVHSGFYIFHFSLAVFWCCLIITGVLKSNWMYSDVFIPFREMQLSAKPIYVALYIAGTGIFIGILLIAVPAIRELMKVVRETDE